MEHMHRPKRTTRILSTTQHWRLVEGVYYRDCWVQLPGGERRVMGVRDDLIGATA